MFKYLRILENTIASAVTSRFSILPLSVAFNNTILSDQVRIWKEDGGDLVVFFDYGSVGRFYSISDHHGWGQWNEM